MNRTDLAWETIDSSGSDTGVSYTKKLVEEIEVIQISIDLEGERKLGKPSGEYFTIISHEPNPLLEEKILASAVKKLIPSGSILVVGLGNRNITPDSVGARAVSGVLATAHFTNHEDFHQLELRKVFTVETGVLAQTGVESVETIKALVSRLKPDGVVVIDALACSSLPRLGNTLQVTDTGIVPGSGVGNMRKKLSKDVLGVPCIAVGGATVIDLDSLCKGHDDKTLMVTPRDIDERVRSYSTVIAKALNSALNPNLSKEEINQLLTFN